MSELIMKKQTGIATPASGSATFTINADNNIVIKTDAGIERTLSTAIDFEHIHAAIPNTDFTDVTVKKYIDTINDNESIFYLFDNEISGATLNFLNRTPPAPLAVSFDDTVTLKSSDGEKFVDPDFLGYATKIFDPSATEIPEGYWKVNLFAKVDDASFDTHLRAHIYALHIDETMTELFSQDLPTIDMTDMFHNCFWAGIQPMYSLVNTDRILIKVGVVTTSPTDRLVTFTHGSVNEHSSISVPIISKSLYDTANAHALHGIDATVSAKGYGDFLAYDEAIRNGYYHLFVMDNFIDQNTGKQIPYSFTQDAVYGDPRLGFKTVVQSKEVTINPDGYWYGTDWPEIIDAPNRITATTDWRWQKKTGTSFIATGSYDVIGTNTKYLTEAHVGAYISIPSGYGTFYAKITSIVGNTHLVVDTPNSFPADISDVYAIDWVGLLTLTKGLRTFTVSGLDLIAAGAQSGMYIRVGDCVKGFFLKIQSIDSATSGTLLTECPLNDCIDQAEWGLSWCYEDCELSGFTTSNTNLHGRKILPGTFTWLSGSNIVTGIGCDFIASGIKPGMRLSTQTNYTPTETSPINGDVTVLTVDSATQLTLVETNMGGDLSGYTPIFFTPSIRMGEQYDGQYIEFGSQQFSQVGLIRFKMDNVLVDHPDSQGQSSFIYNACGADWQMSRLIVKNAYFPYNPPGSVIKDCPAAAGGIYLYPRSILQNTGAISSFISIDSYSNINGQTSAANVMVFFNKYTYDSTRDLLNNGDPTYISVSAYGQKMINGDTIPDICGGGMIFRSAVNYNVEYVSADTTTTQRSHIYIIDASAGNIAITLQTTYSTYISGREIEFIRIDNTSNTVQIIPDGGEQIDGITAPIFIKAKGRAVLKSEQNTGWVTSYLNLYNTDYSPAQAFVDLQVSPADITGLTFDSSKGYSHKFIVEVYKDADGIILTESLIGVANCTVLFIPQANTWKLVQTWEGNDNTDLQIVLSTTTGNTTTQLQYTHSPFGFTSGNDTIKYRVV